MQQDSILHNNRSSLSEEVPWENVCGIPVRANEAHPILSALPDEYIERFHNRNILIVDDNRELGERTEKQLAELYSGKVKYIASPRDALRLLQSEEPENSYDCIVLDVIMPEMWGTDFLKQLTGDIPAIVLYTMSISNDAFADVCDQLGTYQANGSRSLVATHTERLDAIRVPAAPILRQHKTGSLHELVLKIDQAMLLKDSGFGSMAEFLDYYAPKNYPKTASDHCIHAFSELAVELAHQIETLCDSNSKQLKEMVGSKLAAELAKLKSITFHNLVGETSKESNERMHEAIFRVTSFCRTEPGAFVSDMSTECSRTWNALTSDSLDKINQVFATHKNLSSGIKDAATLIRGAAAKAEYPSLQFGFDGDPTIDATILDPENQISGLLDAVFQAFSARAGATARFASASCTVRIVTEAERSDEDLQTRTRLSQINAGNYLELGFYDSAEASLDDLEIGLVSRLASLIRNKQGVFIPYSSDGAHYFTLAIKLSEYSGKPLDVDAIERITSDSYILNEQLAVTERVVGERTLALLGEKPDCWKMGQKPLYFTYGNYHILASGNNFSHAAAYFLIKDYLAHLDSDNSELRAFWRSTESSGYIYDQSIRLEAYSSALLIDTEGDCDASLCLVDLLNNYGIEDQKIGFNTYTFNPKAYLPIILPPEGS